MTVAAAILCICVGQALAARHTAKELDDQFTTVALVKGDGGIDENGYLKSEVRIPVEMREWLEEMDQSDSEIVKTVAEHGFLSASIPELTPLNYTQGGFIAECFHGGNHLFYIYDPETDGRPYSSAMLVITLEEVTDPVELIVDESYTFSRASTINDFGSERLYTKWVESLGENKLVAGYQITLSGTITEVVSLQEGFRDPVGMTARLDISLPTVEELDALDLDVGQSYLVYGMDYYDEDWAFRGLLADKRNPEGGVAIDAFDLRNLHYYTEDELKKLNPDSGIVAWYSCRISPVQEDTPPRYLSMNLTAQECARINSVSMTLWEDFRYITVDDYNGTYLHSPYVDLRPDVTYGEWNGETVTMSWKKYTERYQIPTFTRLDGSVEGFLQSEKGAVWQQALQWDAVNHHAFAVLGTDNAMYLAYFAQEQARISQGRDFTEEEVQSGAKICIINEAVAAASGLAVGDTVTLKFYHGDYGLPYQGLRGNNGGYLMPSAAFYFDTTPVTEMAEYTIVGLWSSPDTWPDIALNEYALSPNTVIVPKTSVQTTWEDTNSVLYTTTVLYNGRMEEFQNFAKAAGFYSNFTCFDQGYTELVGNFHDFEVLAQQVLIVGSVVYTVILLLFLLLYPGFQGNTVATMRSLGVSTGKCFSHVILSTGAIVVPATILGGGVGLLMWQSVLNALLASVETAVDLELPASTLLLIALAQFLFAMLLTAVVAAFVAAPTGLSKRRNR